MSLSFFVCKIIALTIVPFNGAEPLQVRGEEVHILYTGECSMATKEVTQFADANEIRNGLLPTPPMPKGLPKANLTDNARQVLMKR